MVWFMLRYFEISRTGNILILRPGDGSINLPPTAVVTATPDSGLAPLLVQFSSSGSSDSDGSIDSYHWNFGDTGTSTQENPSHTYNQTGTYSASLIVTDNDGTKDTTTVQVKVMTANVPPTAVATATPDSGLAPLAIQFIGSGSTDSDGTIVSFNWNFGDGTTSAQADTQHTYSQSGTYAARLIVTDNDGAQDTASVQVKAVSTNQPPMAIATATPDSGLAPLAVQFTGSGSTDSDGTITSFKLEFR